ncbi:RagB/SusD family nutrient uptake outer membrane protein [termite gut metagenome]|uniref:RagB/SusD family nutrient uptake outer membrane protein n=1 Tax=termite gut metagenome TaxID=433724 RepID=A0A5J4S5D0_9ZZZZ
MKKVFYIIYYVLAILFLPACNDVLDMKPLDKLSEEDVWKDQALIQLYVNTTYRALPSGFQGDILTSASDEAYCIHNSGSYRLILRGELSPDNVSDLAWTLNYWKTAYSRLREINIFFSKINDVPVEESFRKASIGEMTFLRAFIYANLLARYGGFPIITNVFGLNEDYSVRRNSYDECVKYIVDELNSAIPLLPDKQPDSQLGRASADACRALKSRVLLYAASPLVNTSNDKSKWQAAADAAKELLNTNRYALESDYQQTFLKDNNEIILACSYSQANATDFHLYQGRNGSNGWGAENPTQGLVDAFETLNGEQPYLDNGSVNLASGYDPNHPYDNRDPRLSAAILYDGSVWAGRETETYRGGLDSPESSIQSWNASMTGYYLKKFLHEEIPPTGGNIHPTSPWIFFRYGEILLNYAEAMFELGDENTAREYLNIIRSRESVQMPLIPISVTGDALRKKIYNERRIELVFEGHRFFDVRRWKIAMETENVDMKGVNILIDENGIKTYDFNRAVLQRQFSEQHYWLPLPRAEIDKSLGTLEQSPIYK